MKPPMMKKAAAKTNKMAAAPPMATPMHDDMKYRAEDALRTLTRAHEIKQDAALMEHVKRHAAKQKDMLSTVMRRKT
jgi:3-oxoacyl-ACP reductase-like protein